MATQHNTQEGTTEYRNDGPTVAENRRPNLSGGSSLMPPIVLPITKESEEACSKVGAGPARQHFHPWAHEVNRRDFYANSLSIICSQLWVLASNERKSKFVGGSKHYKPSAARKPSDVGGMFCL